MIDKNTFKNDTGHGLRRRARDERLQPGRLTKLEHRAGDVDIGQKIVTVESPAEIASWFFPHEPEEDELRAARRKAIKELLDKRIAEAACANDR